MSRKKPNPHRKGGQCARLRRQEILFRRLTGVSVEKFDQLLDKLEPLFAQNEVKRLSSRPANAPRQRAIGGGRNYDLPLCDRLLVLLMYYRFYTSHAFLGFWFQVDARTIGRSIKGLEPRLAQIFRIPERKLKLSPQEWAEIEQLFFDATEQATQRPQKKAEQKRHYSGKKKRHTLKHQAVTDQKGRILAVSRAYPGSVHDKNVYDREAVDKPPDKPAKGDSGYQGSDLHTPHKKPRGGALSEEQKAHNRQHASQRIGIEHSFGHTKIWAIASHRYRNARSRHTLIFKNVVGLHNLMFA